MEGKRVLKWSWLRFFHVAGIMLMLCSVVVQINRGDWALALVDAIVAIGIVFFATHDSSASNTSATVRLVFLVMAVVILAGVMLGRIAPPQQDEYYVSYEYVIYTDKTQQVVVEHGTAAVTIEAQNAATDTVAFINKLSDTLTADVAQEHGVAEWRVSVMVLAFSSLTS